MISPADALGDDGCTYDEVSAYAIGRANSSGDVLRRRDRGCVDWVRGQLRSRAYVQSRRLDYADEPDWRRLIIDRSADAVLVGIGGCRRLGCVGELPRHVAGHGSGGTDREL